MTCNLVSSPTDNYSTVVSLILTPLIQTIHIIPYIGQHQTICRHRKSYLTPEIKTCVLNLFVVRKLPVLTSIFYVQIAYHIHKYIFKSFQNTITPFVAQILNTVQNHECVLYVIFHLLNNQNNFRVTCILMDTIIVIRVSQRSRLEILLQTYNTLITKIH